MKRMKEIKPYDEAFFPPVPGRAVRYFRTNIPWQIFRFFHINWKMTWMIKKSHH
jgi:hypothetical protein